ncbi:MAG TPA: hopanoid biosynthesis-associated protein HpnK [Stellaceae bacterium]|nr:hopanoid biosynthesis-associated protein HpnK [Stellaceae bacterium]
MKRLIVTADDFGLTLSVNEAVEEGHRHGILTAASLMVSGDAAADAVARAKRLPKLGVGLHLVLVDGVPALPPEQIPALVGRDGRFSANVFAQGVRIFCLPSARHQLAAEIRAQLSAFRATGLALDHVNAHHHFHLHPTIQQTLLRLAPEFGIRAVRLPLEPPAASGQRSAWLTGSLEARHAHRLRQNLDAAGMAHNDRIFGLADTGAMTAERVRYYLERLPDGVSEIYFHPAAVRPPVWPAEYRCAEEAAALTDPEIQALVARRGIELMPFVGLAHAP